MYVNESYNLAKAETKSDTVNFALGTCDALYVGEAANVTVVLDNGDTVLFTSAPVGVLPIRCKRVNSTGTNGSGYVALYRK